MGGSCRGSALGNRGGKIVSGKKLKHEASVRGILQAETAHRRQHGQLARLRYGSPDTELGGYDSQSPLPPAIGGVELVHLSSVASHRIA